MGELKAFRAVVRGRVQGVFFRASTQMKAERLHLRGRVRNLPDGTVEVYAEGEKSSLEELIDYLKKGPPAARVDDVLVEWWDYRGEYSGFQGY